MSKNNYSALNRKAILKNMDEETFDLVVIGGGITGAGIALDAASRGLKTALVEKRDFAWGTSSRSTKLIHGGLRYLKQFEISLVREVGRERAIVHRNARHLVIPEKMLLPIIEGGSLGKALSSIGLWVYDFLAEVEKKERRQMVDKNRVMELEPLLRTDVLKGGGLYFEYRTDDARLTIETIKTAIKNDAQCINYAEVVNYLYDNNGKINGVKVADRLNEGQITIHAKKIVNATGPWVDKLRKLDGDEIRGKRLQLTKGVHVVVPRSRLPIQQAVYFDVDVDNRMQFAIPRGEVTYIGTTDTLYNEKIDKPHSTKEDVDYILAATNYMFPSVKLQREDVVSTWAGLRPLIHEEGKGPSELSRKDEIFFTESGLISIAGGKLTGYRKMAERVVNKVIDQLGEELGSPYDDMPYCQTEHLQLSGAKFKSDKDFKKFIASRSGEVSQIQISPAQVLHAIHKYGRNIDAIIEKTFELYPTIQDPNRRWLKAEVWYGVTQELCNNLSDFLIRRTGRLYFERQSLAELIPLVADDMGELLAWSDSRKVHEIASFKKAYEAVMQF